MHGMTTMLPTTVRVHTERAVTRDVWVEHNRSVLDDLYDIVANANHSTGRMIFDKMSRVSWYDLAYTHSTIYGYGDAWLFEDESESALVEH